MSYSPDEIEQIINPDIDVSISKMGNGGLKYDGDKPRMDLIPPYAMEEMAKVLGVGAKKYDDDNWRKLDKLESRYIGALLRHVNAIMKGELYDEETGLLHSAHALCCIAFICEYHKKMELGIWNSD